MQTSGGQCRENANHVYQRHCERSEAIHASASGKMDCFAALAMTLGCLKIESEPPRNRRINLPVTSFIYTLPTISPRVLRAWVERVVSHVAFEDSGLGASAGRCRPVRARRVAAGAAALHRGRRDRGPDRADR